LRKPSDRLATELQTFVKKNLAAHEYPREIEFIDELPMTTTQQAARKMGAQAVLFHAGTYYLPETIIISSGIGISRQSP
jgi:hypothetical protein